MIRTSDGLHSVPLTPAPLTAPPWGEGEWSTASRCSTIPLPEFAQRPSAKRQSDACCSLSPRERARVRGNDSSTATGAGYARDSARAIGLHQQFVLPPRR